MTKKTLPYLLLYFFTSVVLYLCCYKLADNHFIFSLDDAYIHLAVAENILKGGYGINIPEYSSPSSSILFPYLLAALLKLKISGTWAALLLNIIPTVITINILVGYYYKKIKENNNKLALKLFPLIALLLILSVNAIALPFTGMENSLHVSLTAITFLGLIQLFEKNKVAAYLLVGIILLPLIRFEGFALSGIAIIALLYQRKYKPAFLCIAIIGITILSYLLYMHSIGLPSLPSSVLTKSSASASILGLNFFSTLFVLIKGFILKISNGDAGTIFFLFVLYVFFIVKKEKLILAAGLTILAHLLAGSFGWFYRYEVYGVVVILLSIPSIVATMQQSTQFKIMLFTLLFFSLSYIKPILYTPLSTKGIYEQQQQMHVFATRFFSHNVAVNDLGLVAYKNDNYVLDLWGLGSEPVRKLRSNGALNKAAVHKMTNEKLVKFAMLYDEWFPNQIPNQWELGGYLTTSKFGTAYPKVAFYLTDSLLKKEFITSLKEFKKELPVGASFEIVIKED